MSNLLFEIYKKLILNESIDVNSITDSIKNKYRVVINYEGDPWHGIAPGMRVIEVYAYGITSAGNPVIRAFQPYGDTASTVPNWKFFRIDRIKTWKPTYSIITKPAPKFNPNGDGSMKRVYLIADFSEKSDISNIAGPKQTPKIVGQLDNMEKTTQDWEKDRKRSSEMQRTIQSPIKPLVKPVKTPAPEIKGDELVKKQEIPEPEIQGVENKTTQNEPYKPEGEMSELEKVKDLNRRLDQARMIDLNKIPKK